MPEGAYADHLNPVVLLAMNTGLRRGELLALDWSDINLQARMLTVRRENAKSGKQRHVPLNAEAMTVLLQWKSQGNGSGSVFGVSSIKSSWDTLLTTALTWLYFAFCESSAWQATVGKLALGIRVTDMQGARISFPRALGRYLAKYLSAIILGIGFIMVAFTRRKQGLHDLIAGTLVLNGRASEFKDAPAKPTANGGSFSA